MPTRAASPCSTPRCPNLKPCAAHPRVPWDRRKRQASGNGWAWQRTRLRILERDGYVCHLRIACAGAKAEVVDHVLNRARHGDESDENLVAACKACNEAKRRVEAAAGRRSKFLDRTASG